MLPCWAGFERNDGFVMPFSLSAWQLRYDCMRQLPGTDVLPRESLLNNEKMRQANQKHGIERC